MKSAALTQPRVRAVPLQIATFAARAPIRARCAAGSASKFSADSRIWTTGGAGSSRTAARYIEERRAAGEVPLELALGSMLADLELLSRADAFVGTSASWVSRLALLAIIGEKAAIPPFALLDAPFLCVWCT